MNVKCVHCERLVDERLAYRRVLGWERRPWGGPSGESPVSMEHADGPPEERVGICDYPWDAEEGDFDHA